MNTTIRRVPDLDLFIVVVSNLF